MVKLISSIEFRGRRRSFHRIAIAAILCALLSIASARAQQLFDVDLVSGRTHLYDVLHTVIDIRLDDVKREVSGTVAHRIRSINPALSTVQLDAAANMTFSRVAVDGSPVAYRHEGEELRITLPRNYRYDEQLTVEVTYAVVPTKGLYFIVPDSLSPGRRRQIWTQGEAQDNHFWLPMYDYPNDLMTVDLRATVRGDWQLLSNGALRSTRRNSDGTTTWHYAMEKPHVGYLILIVAGDYLITRDTVDGRIPLEYWSYRDMPERVAVTFGRTPAMMRYFERLIGIPYPWNKYAQAMVSEFIVSGMENTTATTLNDFALVDERAILDYNPDVLIAHEIAHQWFGDLVTNRSWGHLWLHEGYATYLSARFIGKHYGADAMAKELHDHATRGLETDRSAGRDPIALGQGLVPNLYQRASRVLHMLNALVGDEQFWRASRLFLERHTHGLVETNDLKVAFEDVTGYDLDWFFDQWIYGAGAPDLEVRHEHRRDTLYLTVRQRQTQDSLTGLFEMAVPVEVHTKNRVIADTILITQEEETFAIHAPERPRFVIFDAGDVNLRRVKLIRSEEEMMAQLEAPRMIDRLHAAQELMATDSISVRSTTRPAALRAAFMREPSPYVREAIVNAAASFTSPMVEEIVLAALRDSATTVRQSGVTSSFKIADKTRRAAVLRPLLADSSMSVMADALGMLAVTDPKGLEPYLQSLKGVRGRRDRIAQAWLNAVMTGKYRSLADDVASYTMPPYSISTRNDAFLAMSLLDTTTATMREAIVYGIRDRTGSIRSSALLAARRHLDQPMRQMLLRLRDELSAEGRRELEKVLE